MPLILSKKAECTVKLWASLPGPSYLPSGGTDSLIAQLGLLSLTTAWGHFRLALRSSNPCIQTQPQTILLAKSC